MKKKILALVCITSALTWADSLKIIKIEGPEARYNSISIVNGTSMSNFTCKVGRYKLESDGSYCRIGEQGIYMLKEFGDTDSNKGEVHRQSYIGVEIQSTFPGELVYDIEYKDFPFYDAIVIHLNEKSKSTTL